MRLHLHEWGEPASPALVCLHGITAHGRRFRKLAEERLAAHWHVLAPDLRGHGRSTWEPPWTVATHLADVLETVPADRAVWLGHSFGARLVIELAAREPARIHALVLLDPAIRVLPHVGMNMADEQLKEPSYASAEEAIQERIDSGRVFHTPRELLEEEMREHLEHGSDGRLRFRYSRSAVIAAYSELALPPPSLEHVRVPTLLVLGEHSWLVLDDDVEALRAALGDLLEIVRVPGGHTVFWDAFAETADALDSFLSQQARSRSS